MIPAQAVEAAARVMQAMDVREGLGDYPLDQYTEDVTAILEAAAPHLLAQGWDEGEAAGQDNADSNRGYNIEHKHNPYRSTDRGGRE